ncbi:MAG: Holliday junction resolvase RecU [Mollicutes bacterium]|nr:Holliday junction resolvase RecU [Mollicutes bacterium]
MNYPGNINKQYQKKIDYGNRGIDLENLVNIANELYLQKDLAIIYKKPTPIQVITYNYNNKRITDAFYKSQSTLDYNGVYKGFYIEFDAKNTNRSFLPINNISNHQLEHMEKIISHNGICFLLIMIQKECYLLEAQLVLDFVSNSERKSIPYDFIKMNGHNIKYDYLRGADYLIAIDQLIKEKV